MMAGNTQYLLPCTCGKQVKVVVAQAGLSVRCECGKELSVPSVRGMTKLERVVVEEAPRSGKRSAWGPRQSLFSLGTFIILSAVIAAAVIYWLRPENPSRRIAERLIYSLAPVEQLDYWQTMRDRQRLTPVPHNEMDEYVKAVAHNRRWLGVAVGAGLVGVFIAAGGLFVPSPENSRGR